MNFEKLAKELIEKMIEARINKMESKINEGLKGEDFVLLYLLQKNEVVEPGMVSKELSLSTARVAKVLQQLEDKELLTRSLNLNDRRKIDVSLTNKGLALASSKQEEFIMSITSMLRSLGEHDASEYIRITNKLIDINCNFETTKEDERG